MAFLGSATCSRCGASMAGGVARCPFCGTSTGAAGKPGEAPAPPGTPSGPPRSAAPSAGASSQGLSARPRPSISIVRTQPKWVVPAIAAGIVLAGGLAISLLGREPPPGAATSSTASSPAIAASVVGARLETAFYRDPARVDASDLYPRVKERALAWNPDARLVSISASPVVGDKVDLTQYDAEIVYIFGADSARSPPFGHLAIAARRGGLEESPWTEAPRPRAPNAKAPPPPTMRVVEPNCVFDAAARAAHASGIPAGTVMKLRYEGDSSLNRGIWTARVLGRAELDRVIDGQSCAIVARR